jgi:outer membrane protein assembly factor BamB
MRVRRVFLSALVYLVVVGVFVAVALGADWRRFGLDPARRNATGTATGITARNVGALLRQQVVLPGTADSSAIYLHDVPVLGAQHDVLILTTAYGRTLAIAADTGSVLWQYVPPGIGSWEGSAQITNASPVADPERRYVYAASPDGEIHKLDVSDGSEVTSGKWPVAVTRDPQREKIGPALNLWGNLVLVATGGYIGDYPLYQGHVVAIDRESGRIVNVFNALCSNHQGLLNPRACSSSGAAIWGRGGVVVEPDSGRLLVATGNGPWDGRHDWGDSVLELSANAGRLLQSYTPADEASLEERDLDLGSASPAVLPHGLVLQAGKDGRLRLLSLTHLNGRPHTAGPVTGGELQILPSPGAGEVLTAPAVTTKRGQTRVFVADYAATAAYALTGGAKPNLRRLWQTRHGGSSPVLAGGLLYAYDPLHGGLNVYNPDLPRPIATLPAGTGHWNSPIIADGRIALPEGDANKHATTGILDIYRLPTSAD